MTLFPAHPPRSPLPRLRVIAAVLTVLCVALGLSASPLMTDRAHAEANCGTGLQCVSFTSVSNGRALDVQNGSRDDGAIIVTNTAPGYHQSWRLSVDPSDSSFTIVNNTTGKCVDLSWPALRQQTCRGQKSQKWYFQPVSGAGPAGQAFMIRNESDNSCLDLLNSAQYDDAWTSKSTCHGRTNQQWTTTAAEARNLAVDHGAKRCQRDASSCTWATKSEAPAAPLPKVCASAVWYNNTDGPISQAFSVTHTSGWQSSIGTDFKTQLAGGAMEVLQATVASGVSFQQIWQGSKSVNDSVTVSVPTKQYGWVTLSVLAKKVTGTWTFDAYGFPWTAEDTVTVPLKGDPSGGATVYIANTSPNFTSCV
ncbi:RICIN domain-containing protein [Streptomyces sp. MST-110588]|uniref:RICIN domain-containing protein n=1 Tax=Streptomyces sp. MST-110588 TaxID=2833628 RepID=UPI001F5C6CCE|nr:RICIN domain-containing protein [Streptomyces sp. MST-110588]UNO43334.1 RICIN domain-containing protein [Streptomyces sp. MST-110588]